MARWVDKEKKEAWEEVTSGLKYESWAGNSQEGGVRSGKEGSVEDGERSAPWALWQGEVRVEVREKRWGRRRGLCYCVDFLFLSVTWKEYLVSISSFSSHSQNHWVPQRYKHLPQRSSLALWDSTPRGSDDHNPSVWALTPWLFPLLTISVLPQWSPLAFSVCLLC